MPPKKTHPAGSAESKIFLYSACFSGTPVDKATFERLLSEINDWDKLCIFVNDRQGSGLVLRRLYELGLTNKVPAHIIGKWKQTRLKTISRNMVVAEHFRSVAKAFRKKGIDLIAMKGIYLAEGLYPEPGLRQFGDIDLLVKENDGDAALEVLRKIGYFPSDLTNQLPKDVKESAEAFHFPPMFKSGVSVEVHTNLAREKDIFNINPDELWNSAVTVTLYGEEVKVFSPEYQFLTLALHLNKHFEHGAFLFTGYFDLLNLLHSNPLKIKWNQLLQLCEQTGSKEIVTRHMSLINKYFNIQLPAEFNSARASNRSNRIFGQVLLKGTSSREMLKFIFNFSTKDFSLRSRITRIRYILFPSAEYLKKFYQLEKDDLLWKYYLIRLVEKTKKMLGWNK